MLFTPLIKGAPVLPLAFANPIVANLTQPALLDSFYALVESPTMAALLPLCVCQVIAKPAPEPHHTLVPVIHRTRQVELAHPPSAWTEKP